MPQMAPMNWTLLFISFISLFLVCMIMVYFTSNPSLGTSALDAHSATETNVLWKW